MERARLLRDIESKASAGEWKDREGGATSLDTSGGKAKWERRVDVPTFLCPTCGRDFVNVPQAQRNATIARHCRACR